MTSRSLTSADNNCNLKFFASTLKGAWTQGVIYSVIFFIFGPVFLLIAANSYNRGYYYMNNRSMAIADFVEAISSTYMLFYFISAFIAVACAVAMFSYLDARVNVNFYHSLPFTRTRMFFIHYLSGLAIFVMAFGINYLIAISVPAFTNMGFAECFPVISSIFGNALICFILFYSLTVMIGMLTGYAPAQWLVTAIAVGILPAIKVGAVLLMSFYNSNIWTDYYLSFEKFMFISPGTYLFVGTRYTLATKLILLGFSALFTIAAIIIYHYRKSERSGNPIVFNRFASFIKYLVMFPSAIGSAIIFAAMGDEQLFWLLFGGVIGCFLSWIAMNSIINKTARAMFRGLKGFIIFTVIMLVYICGVVFGTEYVFENFVTFDTTRSFTLELGGNGEIAQFDFKEEENRDAIMSIIDKYEAQFASDETQDVYAVVSKDDYYDNYDYIKIDGKEYYLDYPGTQSKRIRVVAKDIFGVEHARTLHMYFARADINAELRTIANSNEYKTQLYEILDGIDENTFVYLFVSPNEIKDGEMMVYGNSDVFPINAYMSKAYNEENREIYDFGFIDAYKRDVADSGDLYGMLSAPSIGEIELSYTNKYGEHSYFYLPITEEFESTVEWLADKGLLESTNYSYDVATAVDKMYVYDFETGKTLEVRSTKQKAELIEKTGIGITHSGGDSYFAPINTRYSVITMYEYVDGDKEMVYTEENGAVTKEYYNSSNRTVTLHIIGEAPEFVTKYFDK